jgi:hypothetical protein
MSTENRKGIQPWPMGRSGGMFFLSALFSGSLCLMRIRKKAKIPQTSVKPAIDKNIPFTDQSINLPKTGGPMATPRKRTEL